MTLDNIVADFEFLDDREDRYRYVIELGQSLPPLPEAARGGQLRCAAAPVRSGSRPRSMAPPPGPRRASASRATATPTRAMSREARGSEPRTAPTNNHPLTLFNLVRKA